MAEEKGGEEFNDVFITNFYRDATIVRSGVQILPQALEEIKQ